MLVWVCYMWTVGPSTLRDRRIVVTEKSIFADYVVRDLLRKKPALFMPTREKAKTYSMALAEVASESGRTLNGSRWFGRSLDNELMDDSVKQRRSSPYEAPSSLMSAESSVDKSFCLDVMLKLLDANSQTLSTVGRQSSSLAEFVNCFIATHSSLLRDNSSPLVESDRFFIALMAAEMHRCHSLVCIYANEYLLHGGDVNWLKGLCANASAQTQIPRKFRHLGEINEILAHTPWMITKGHIAKLAATQGERWSMSELIQAFIILAHVHSLASLVAGFRLSPGQSAGDANRMQDHDEQEPKISPKLSIGDKHDETLRKRLSGYNLVETLLNNPGMSCVELCQKHCEEIGANAPLSPHYFSWEVQGYSLANMTNVQFGDLIDQELKSVKTLFHSHGANHADIRCSPNHLMEKVSSEVSDSQKYHAIWLYVHCLLGISYDDCKHSQLDVLLSTDLRSYIKLVTFCPERMSQERFRSVVQSVGDCDKMNVHAVVAEARLQVELMFCLNAILQYQTGESNVVR